MIYLLFFFLLTIYTSRVLYVVLFQDYGWIPGPVKLLLFNGEQQCARWPWAAVLWPPCWSVCSINQDRLSLLTDMLNHELVGQPVARRRILQAVSDADLALQFASSSSSDESSGSTDNSNQNTAAAATAAAAAAVKGPVVMHWAGDNGVGKTFSAQLMARAFFARNAAGAQDPGAMWNALTAPGFLYIRGEEFHSRNRSTIPMFRQRLRQRVVDSLAQCAKSLIVVDELEKIHRDTVAVLSEFLDSSMPVVRKESPDTSTSGAQTDNKGGSFAQSFSWSVFSSVLAYCARWTIDTLMPGAPAALRRHEFVSTQSAVFVFISDFGAAGFSHGMTDRELEAHVFDETRAIWQVDKNAHLLSRIVPFFPLTTESLAKLIDRKTRSYTARFQRSVTSDDEDGKRTTRKSLHVSFADGFAVCLARHSQTQYHALNARGVDRMWTKARETIDLFIYKHQFEHHLDSNNEPPADSVHFIVSCQADQTSSADISQLIQVQIK